MGVASSKTSDGISARERWRNLEKFARDHDSLLATTGGVVLPAATRLAVAQYTRAALDCRGCEALPSSVRLKPGADIYNTIAQLDHSTCSPSLRGENVLPDAIVHMIHSLVNHQPRIESGWYKTTLEKLDELNLIDKFQFPAGTLRRETLLLSLFTELVHVISLSLCFDLLYRIMGKETPLLPRPSLGASPPSYFDWTKALKKEAAIRRDTALVAWIPFLISKDLDPESEPIKSLHDVTRTVFLSAIENEMHAYTGAMWSPTDLEFLKRVGENVYVDSSRILMPWRGLDAAIRCADQFSRHDLETVAFAYSEAVSCNY